MLRLPARSTPLPYTTLFRSGQRLTVDRGLVRTEALASAAGGPAGGVPAAAQTAPAAALQPQVGVAAGAPARAPVVAPTGRSEEHTSELQSLTNLVCRLLLEK